MVTIASRSRRVYIDQARGIAVLLMIGAHVTDAWTRPASRHGAVFRDVVVLGVRRQATLFDPSGNQIEINEIDTEHGIP